MHRPPPVESVPPGTSDSDLRDETNRRTHKAGYTDRDGQPLVRGGVRSRYSGAYSANYRRVFGHD